MLNPMYYGIVHEVDTNDYKKISKTQNRWTITTLNTWCMLWRWKWITISQLLPLSMSNYWCKIGVQLWQRNPKTKSYIQWNWPLSFCIHQSANKVRLFWFRGKLQVGFLVGSRKRKLVIKRHKSVFSRLNQTIHHS